MRGHPSRPGTIDLRDRQDDLGVLADRLVPWRNRREVLLRLDRLFRTGVAPDPPVSGALDGRLVASTTWAPWDGLVARLAAVWMPWLGKSFDPATSTGVNRFARTRAARGALRLFFPGRRPEGTLPDPIEDFTFRTRVAPGELDHTTNVLKIDYDLDANPALVRHVLDELVQVAPGRYLGKVLLRLGGRYHQIGYFSLLA